jgi:NADPH:quinone reductase-like Zn-dependent oxidoreductase
MTRVSDMRAPDKMLRDGRSRPAQVLPDTMRAIRQRSLGGPEVLQPVTVSRPEPGPTEVLVRVTAAGVNPVDWKTRASGGFLVAPPFTVGWDVAGVVEAVGLGVTRFEVGDRVFGMPRFPHEAAAYAEYVTAPSRQLARIPDGVGDIEAGAVPLAALIAWQSLVDTARVGAGQRVLIQAAAGGVGHLAVQIAKSEGAYVIGTDAPEKQEFLRTIGVDEPIDYTSTDVVESARDVDVVLDLIGGEIGRRSLATLRPGGLLVSVPTDRAAEVLEAAEQSRTRATGILVEPDGHALEQIAALLDSGRLRVEIASVLPLEQAGHAHQLGESGQAQGKIVLAGTER